MEGLGGYIFTGLISLVVGLLLQRLQPQVKLRYWMPHTFFFDLQQENVVLQTDSLSVQNLGRKAATNVEIIHKTRPDFFKFAPSIHFEEAHTPDGEHVIRIPSLGPKEHVFLQLLSYKTAPKLMNVRSSEGPATWMQIQVQPWVPPWAQKVATGFILLGVALTLYWVIRVAWHLSKTIGII